MALLEGAEAGRAFASGMAAVTNAVMSQVRAGDHIVAARPSSAAAAMWWKTMHPASAWPRPWSMGGTRRTSRGHAPNTKIVFIETPTNPTLELVDIPAVAEIAHAHGAKLIVDNVFSTALYQKPLELGADLVTYSATKHIDGQDGCSAASSWGPRR